MAENWWEQDETVKPSKAPVAKDDWWAKDETVAKPAKSIRPPAAVSSSNVSQPTGEVHDGDTFRMRNGGNARLSGVDAFELDQQGRMRSGLVPLGQRARDFLQVNIAPNSGVTGTGAQTYGRPVVTLDNNGQDISRALIESGNGLATPEYLRGDPRLGEYMEAERLARLNRRGAFAGQFQTPSDFRKGKPEPWAAPQEGQRGNSDAIFFDDPTPFQGLRPEIEQGYLAIAKNPNSTADDLVAYAKTNGFQIDRKVADRFVKDRASRGVADGVRYEQLPQVITDPGDGTLGAGVRGLADPINMLDELGGLVDTAGLTEGRESLFNSDRRFGDILYNNIDQNRSILAHDDAEHPYARFGGQLASGLVLPGASVEGIGAAAARDVLLAGGNRYVAAQAAKAAVRQRLATAGAAEGALAGFGGAEGGVIDRLPAAGVGGIAGTVLGVGGAELLNAVVPAGRAVVNRARGRVAGDAIDGAETTGARAMDDANGTTPASQLAAEDDRWWDADETIAMDNEAVESPAALTSPRVVDREQRARRPRVTANSPSVDEASDLGPRSILAFVPQRGDPGISVTNEDGHLATAVFRDENGLARGAAQIPLTGEARDSYEAANVYVDPSFRRQGIATKLYDALGREGYPIDEISGSGNLTPEGAAFVNKRNAAVDAKNDRSTLVSQRVVDRIDVNDRARPLLDPASDLERLQRAQRINPGDMLPIPSNEVGSIEEAAAISAGLRPEVKAPNEADELGRRNIPSPSDASRTLPKRGPLDLNTFLRTKGGLADQGGDLRHMGITNAARDLDFARGEQRFGKLVDNENGLNLDEAADLAWREGYFPDHPERPTVAEFLDAIDNTNRGHNRSFRTDDLSEVDAFNAARDQRLAVERSRDEGAPLVEDRGQPVTMEDLEANTPPLSASEDWGDAGGPDFAGNIRLANLDSPQNIKRALTVTDRHMQGFGAARRGKIRQDETESLADELGMTVSDLLSRRKGEAFNAEQALAARQILAKSGNEMVNLARKVQQMDDPGEEALAKFREAWVRHVAIQEQISGITAEAGRTLAQFRMVADGRNVRGNVLNALSESGGGKDRLKAAANLILENDTDAGAMNRAAARALKPKFLDKVNELWVNSLLSGPQTHVVNMVGNTMTALAQIPEHVAAAVVGGARSVATRNRVADRVLFSELGSRSVGLLQGAKEGLQQATRSLRTGEGSDFANKVEAQTQDAISGLKGKIIRVPTRLLSAEDELFKGMARRMELNGLAVRQARKEGLHGKAGIDRVAELVANPTDEMLDRAFDYGRYVTFQRPLGPAMQGISRFTQIMPGAKFILPFVRTPTNLLKFALERSPAAPIVDGWRADFRAGGARRDLAIARAMVGTGVGAVIAELAAQGLVTGNGPADQGTKQLMQADGWQPYSIKVGDKYVSYSRLDPFATTLGVAAGMVELQDHMTEKQSDKVAMLLTASILQNLSSKTWLSGVGDMVEAVNDPARYSDNWVKRFEGSAAVPAGVAQIARTVDPALREAETTLDAIRARIPGVSKSLPARRDVLGRPMVSEGGVGPDIVSPIWQSTQRKDPVLRQLIDAGVHINKPKREVAGRRLDAKEWGQYQQRTGEIGYSGIQNLIRMGEWAKMSSEEKQDEVGEIMTAARKQARGEVLTPP